MNAVLERLRANVFWLMDAIRGGKIKKHLNEIHKSIETSNDNNELTNKKIKLLLQHASETVPFYRKYTDLPIQEFPIVDKTLMRNNAQFLSKIYNDSDRISLVTSGSTGTPFKVFQDLNKKNRNSADTIYFADKAGFKIGNKLTYLKIWSDYNKKSNLQRWFQNILPVDVIKLDNNKIKTFINQLENDSSTVGLLGYSSALELLVKFLEKEDKKAVNANITSVISMSESLSDDTKQLLTKYFRVSAVSRYSNIENGIIAQQEPNGENYFRINTASYFVEILKFDSDEPVSQNESGRIVVTDLYNYAMPMIRYDTGDVGSFLPSDNNYFAKIEGRKLDQIYNTNGDLISSYIVYKNMWQYTDIIQYQFIQYGQKDYLFKINTHNTFKQKSRLIKEFKEYLGPEANFKIEFVDEIPLLASGKRKKIVNTYHNRNGN